MSFFATCLYLRRNLRAVWPPNASLCASSTCVNLRLLAGPFDQGFILFPSRVLEDFYRVIASISKHQAVFVHHEPWSTHFHCAQLLISQMHYQGNPLSPHRFLPYQHEKQRIISQPQMLVHTKGHYSATFQRWLLLINWQLKIFFGFYLEHFALFRWYKEMVIFIEGQRQWLNDIPL